MGIDELTKALGVELPPTTMTVAVDQDGGVFAYSYPAAWLRPQWYRKWLCLTPDAHAKQLGNIGRTPNWREMIFEVDE